MPLLPYCVLLTKALGKLPAKGIRDAEIQTKHVGELASLYSEVEKSRIALATFQQAALEFHRVVHGVFDYAAVIPFRFPTWLSEEELEDHLKKESAHYHAFLTHHADQVQMELRLTHLSGNASQKPASTGTEHLRARAAQLHHFEQSAEELKTLLSAEVVDWRERDLQEGKRLYALVERSDVVNFRERLSQQKVRWSGPWPATEFLTE
jgi:hypothetical protein